MGNFFCMQCGKTDATLNKTLIASTDYHTPIYRIKSNLVKWMQMWDLGHLMCHKSNLHTATPPQIQQSCITSILFYGFLIFMSASLIFLYHPLRQNQINKFQKKKTLLICIAKQKKIFRDSLHLFTKIVRQIPINNIQSMIKSRFPSLNLQFRMHTRNVHALRWATGFFGEMQI